MEYLLLNIFVFLRPILFINVGVEVAGFNIFELAAIFMALLLIAMFVYKLGLKKRVYISAIDLLIIFFTLWCLAIFFAYLDDANVKAMAKLIIPLWTFIVVKNVITDRSQFLTIIFILIVGYSIPLVLSSALIFKGQGLDVVNYWTGIARYKGVYSDTHNMGHNMTFVIMMVVAYLSIYVNNLDEKKLKMHVWKKIFFSILIILALYCLYKCWVRTAALGLIVFIIIYLFFYNKKILLSGIAATVILGILFAPVIVPRFLHDFEEVLEGDRELEKLGSGRLKIWDQTIKGFRNATLDRKIAGNGIGNVEGLSGRQLDTHSDFFGLIEETGLVGWAIYMLLQLFILKRIISMSGNDKYLFLAIFFAVFMMNFVSNSYISRFGMAQLYFLIMAYIELPSKTISIVARVK